MLRRAFYDGKGWIGRVIWRFAPRAAARAAEFCFHPKQTVEEEEDGSLIVRFRAAGWLEMVWHLYSWGDAVEVIAPAQPSRYGRTRDYERRACNRMIFSGSATGVSMA
ncbi:MULTISPECIES: WYL domain-containing protein [Rhizobium]|uniref:WYL domain-containing protein n=1 Tax=Rhizobium ruizarguesonis TaxID=2081791 RepID=UPI00248493ED|nr:MULTISPECIES: WYL domain-containing protein [Rhizobium]